MGTYHYDLDDISYIGSIASIPETGWLVLVSQTTDNAYASIQTVRTYFMAGLIIAIFLVAVLAILLSKTLIRPLSELRSSTKDISGGKYDSIVPTYSYEEIEDLATSFREMTSTIQNRENRLLISEERFRSLVHNIRSGIVVHAADTSIIQSNAMAQKMLGLTEEQMMGKTANDTHWQFFREDGSHTPLEEYPINQVIATRKLLEDHVVGVYNPESDDVVWLLVNAVPEFNQTGELSQVIVTFIDISRRKKAEIALFESEEKYRRFFTTVPSGWAYHKIIVNENNKPVDYIFLEVNEAFEKATGLNKDIIIGKKVTDVITEIQDSEPDLISMYGEVALTGKDKLFELYFKPFNKWYSVNAFSNKINYFITIFSDITERKQVEKELEKHREHLEELVDERTTKLEERTEYLNKSEKALRFLLEDVNEIRSDLAKANEKLKELDNLKSMFIASMSHELRTPLNSIIGFTGIILQGMAGEINDEQKDHLERVYRSGQHLLDLITDIIDISKIEAGKMETIIEAFQLDLLIYDAVDSFKPQINKKGLRIYVTAPPDIQINSDRKRLLQCILNFLSNAVKFTEKGEISVTVNENNGMIIIKVKDTGIGMRDEDMQKLFGSFVRLESHLKTIALGTGLGLYLTKKIASDILGGTVYAESILGQGSTFTIEVPKK
jgi:PAS domain S-box-containing protein